MLMLCFLIVTVPLETCFADALCHDRFSVQKTVMGSMTTAKTKTIFSMFLGMGKVSAVSPSICRDFEMEILFIEFYCSEQIMSKASSRRSGRGDGVLFVYPERCRDRGLHASTFCGWLDWEMRGLGRGSLHFPIFYLFII